MVNDLVLLSTQSALPLIHIVQAFFFCVEVLSI